MPPRDCDGNMRFHAFGLFDSCAVEYGKQCHADIGEHGKLHYRIPDEADKHDERFHAEREYDISDYYLSRLFRYFHSSRNIFDIVVYNDYISRLCRESRAALAHGKADIAAYDNGRIVESVADIGNASFFAVFFVYLLKSVKLILREELCGIFRYADLFGKAADSRALVAAEYLEMVSAERTEFGYSLSRIFLGSIGECDNADILAVCRTVDAGFGFFFKGDIGIFLMEISCRAEYSADNAGGRFQRGFRALACRFVAFFGFIACRSRSSDQTQWAITVRSFQRPYFL